jgi:hypothetical protein
MKLILSLCIAGAAICFSGLAAANAPSSRSIDSPITSNAFAPVAATQARDEEPLRMAPIGGCGTRCGNRRSEPVLVAPTCPGCMRRGEEPLRMAPGCPSCTRGGKEPLRIAPNCGSGCVRGRTDRVQLAPSCPSGCGRNEPLRVAPSCTKGGCANGRSELV